MDEPFTRSTSRPRRCSRPLLEIWLKMQDGFFITHSIDEAVFMADRVIVMGARRGVRRDDRCRPARPAIRRAFVVATARDPHHAWEI